jgi:outer membrane protein
MLPKRLLPLALGLFVPVALAQETPGLLEIYALAVDEDPRTSIARHQVDVSRYQKNAARAELLPQASISMQFSDNEVDFLEERAGQADGSYDGERYAFQVRQMLFNWSTIANRARAAKVVDVREAELLDAMSQLSVDVAERYFGVLLADDNVRLLQAESELVEGQTRQTEALYERKLVSITDYLDTRARADQVRTDLIEAQNAADLAREELSLLTGQPVAALAPLRRDASLPELESTVEAWADRALAGNQALVSKQEAVLAARESVNQQGGRHLPTVDLVYSYQRSDVGFDNVISPKRDTDYVGINVNFELFSGGATSSRIREAWSNYYIARDEEEAVRREVLRRVRGAWLNAQSSRKRIDAAALSVESANTAYEAMNKALGLGAARSADVLNALHLKTRAERDYQQALYSYLFNWLSLQREGGVLDADDIRALDREIIAG